MKINNIRFDGLGDFKDKNVYFPESDSYAEIVDKKDILDWYRDYKYNRKRGYDVEDETFIFIYKDGTYKFCYGMSDPIVEKLTNLIYASNANASGEYVWFDNKPKYLPIIQKVTGMEIAKLDGIKQLQNYSSAKTSLPNNEPKGFKLIDWQKNTVNLDLGGGKTTFGTDYLKKYGVKNLIYDFNYSAKHNKEIAEYVKDNKVDTVTCFNVLNVLDTDAAIENMCLMAAKALKSDGTAYFQVYNKGSKGASQNNQSFQQGEPLSFYVPFVEKYFGKVKKTADLIIATKPIKTTKKSQWQFAFDSNEGLLFGVDNGKNLSGTHYKQLDITEYKFLYKDKEFIFKVGDTIIFKPKSENDQTEIKKIVCFEEQNAACKNGWAHEIWICWADNTNEPVYSVAGTMYKTSLNEYDIVGYKAYNITLQELELQLAMNDEKLSGSGADENFIQDFQENIWKNGFNSVTLRQLDNIINDIQNGRVHIKTEISRRVARNYNRPRGSRNAYASAVICGREGRIYPKISSRNKEEYIKESERSDRYQKLLEEWAKSEGCWIDNTSDFMKKYKQIGKGSEAKVYDVVTKDNHSVFKVIGLNMSVFVQKLIERIYLHNCLFGDSTYIDIIGFGRDENGYFKLIIEQPFIEGRRVRIKRINKFVHKKFPDIKEIDIVSYYTPDFIIKDLHNQNVLKDNKGNFYVIDCFLSFYYGDIEDLKGVDLQGYPTEFYNPQLFFKTCVDIAELEYFLSCADDMIDAYDKDCYGHNTADRAKKCQEWKNYKRQARQLIKDLKQGKKSVYFKISDLICYKGFEESVFQIVDIKKDHYIVRELGDRTQTWNEIPFSDKDKLEKAVSPLLIQEIKLVNNNNSLSGIVQPFYPDHDTDDYLNDYSESKSATQAFLNDVKNFVKRLKKDLELEDYYNKGKKQTITINARDIYVQLVIPYAEKPNTYLHIEFHTNHLLWQYKGLLKGINYDYNVEPTFTIWVGEASCWFNIWNDYDDILKELKYKYSIFRDRKQQTEVSPLLTKELQLLLTKYEFYQYLKK